MARKAPEKINFVQFSTFTDEEWLSFSVCEITEPSPQGGSDKNREGTPYDPRMGCLENGVPCGTCEGDNRTCPGHFGHIVLPRQVYNRTFMDMILKVLQSVCPECASPRLLPDQSLMQIPRSSGLKRLRIFAKKCENKTECPNCEKSLPSFDFNKTEIRRYFGEKSNAVTFKAGEARNVFIRLSNETLGLLGFNSSLSQNEIFTNNEDVPQGKFHVHQFRPESMIYTVLPVIPPFSRPFVRRDGQNCDDDLTDKYNSILKCRKRILEDDGASLEASVVKTRRRGGRMNEVDKQKVELELQNHIWTLMNNKEEKSKLSSGGRAHKGIGERIVGKDGRIQANIGGKRVDQSARSVIIGGGILLKLDQLGVPQFIADELTKKEKVKEWNKAYLQDLVSQGQINRVIRGGITKRLDILPDKGKKFTLLIDDIAERKLRDGDVYLFNRQPTLRKESMMGFKVKIIKGYAFRLGLCFTPSFNADFDGDEMNGHVPQSISATAEAEVLMRAAVHIVTGQRNAPINGIVQDGLVGSYILTNGWEGTETDTMISSTTYIKCIEGAEISTERYNDLLLRAKEYYPDYVEQGEDGVLRISSEEIPGKLAFSILFPANFCYERVTNINSQYPKVEIKDGVLVPTSGPICKQTIGAKTNSIVHVLWKEYSPEIALSFLSEVQQLIDRWLPTHGFSMGISDCLATSKEDVAQVLSEMHVKINRILTKCNREPDEQAEAEINGILNSAMNVGLRLAKDSMAKGDRNALNIMRNSGAKGNLVNLVQIVAFVGQQNIGGRRIPPTLSGGTRTLPHYERGDHSAEARGFVENGYLKGLTPQEVFFHAAGGRVGIISTAIKSVTGDTPLIIIEKGKSKRVLIGDWIDNLLVEKSNKVEYYPKDNNLQVLRIENAFIPTADSHGATSWGELTAVTRHDPSERIYRVKTESGREVTVAESKSLLIWDEDKYSFLPKYTPDVVIGDYAPVAFSLPEPPIIKNIIDMSDYFPKTEYIYGTDILRAYEMMKEFGFKVPRGWWGEHNGSDFTLPYKYPWQILRNFKRSDQQILKTIDDYKEGCIYPLLGKRIDTVFPSVFELNRDNGFFVGLYIADGDSNVKSGHVRVSKNDEVIQSKIMEWFDKYQINHEIYTKYNEMGSSTSVRGFSVMWARFFLEMCGHGARNKHVPGFAFTAPDDFVAGLLDGYISGDGCVSKNGKRINSSSTSKRLTEEMSILLLRFGIFTTSGTCHVKSNNLGTKDIAPIHSLNVNGIWAKEFYELIGCTHPKKNGRLENMEEIGNGYQRYKTQKHCVKDKIVSIFPLKPENSFLYDVTVPKTSYFMIGTGQVVENTAETGYIQKRIGRKVEDYRVEIDGTVRDANGRIIQFYYGDDGMDPKKLCCIDVCPFPFFINPINLARRLNSDAKRQDRISQGSEPRMLNEKEIELLMSFIQAGSSRIKTDVLEQATLNCQETLKDLLCDPRVKLYECIIHLFCAELRNTYETSKAQQGDMVGLDAGCFIGEPTTQMSESRETRVVVREVIKGQNRRLSDVRYGEIGNIIDEYLEKHKDEVIDLGENSVAWKPTHDIYIMTVNTENEKTEWNKLSEISRHPTNGNLVRVKTKSKREVTTTLTHSHLCRTKEGKIIPKKAGELKKGDFVPVSKKMNSGVLYKNISIPKKNDEGTDKFPLDFENGWVLGAYLAEGHISRETQLKITNISEHFEKRVKYFADRYGGKMKTREKEGGFTNKNGDRYIGKDHIVTFIPHIVRFILKYCGTGSGNKKVPGFALFAPLDFVSGLLRGYFDGDGNVNASRQMIRVHSISQNMLEQIALLLSRFGIFGTFGVEKKNTKNPLHSYILLRKHARLFMENIGSDFPEKLSAIQEIIDYNERSDVHSRREDIDRIPEMGEEIARVAKPLNLPGYSRNYGRWTRGKTAIGRETLVQYETLFRERAKELEQDIDLSLIHQAVNSDVIWDEIIEIEIIDDPQEMVYDFGVEGNHTFMIQNGIFTHNTLNSVDWKTNILLETDNGALRTNIGKWIDQRLEERPSEIKHIPENRTEYLELKDNISIPTVSKDGNISWGKVTAVTRHLPVGKLVNVRTKSGREVIATRSKSFLVWSGDGFIPTPGSDIKKGDKVPVTLNLMNLENEENKLPLSRYLPKKEWIYGSDLYLAVEIHKDERRKCGWWSRHNGTTFTLPYKRSDTAMATLKRTKTTSIQPGYVYPLHCRRVKSQVPEYIQLTEEFGFIVGIYLAEGCTTDTFMSISNNEEYILDRVKRWCDEWSITYHVKACTNKRFEGSLSTSIFVHSVLIARWFKIWMGTGAKNKRAPVESFSGPLEFTKGVLDGYFSGDGTVNKRDGYLVMSSSSSGLMEDISSMCSRFSIFGKLSSHQPKGNNIGSENIHRVHTLSIRNKWFVKWREEIGSTHEFKYEKMKLFDHEGCGYFYKQMNDVVLDTIVSIEDYVSDHEYVYDLTVPSTYNFCIYNGLGMRDTFHLAGFKGKDVSLGVPRFNELLNATKSDKQKNTSCIIHFDVPLLNKNAENVVILEKKKIDLTDEDEIKDVEEEIKEMNKTSAGLIQKMRKTFEETTVGTFFLSYEMQYLSDDIEPDKKVSPIGILTYEEYEKKWWVTLREELNGPPEFEPESWILIIKFDTEEMFRRDIDLEDIAVSIQEISEGKYFCVPSPNVLGIIEVYCNFTDIKSYIATKLALPEGDRPQKDSLWTSENINFFTCREVALNYIKNVRISGITGVSKVYAREEIKSHKWVLDVGCRKIATRLSNKRFLDVLTTEGVDPYLTVTDDMHAICSVLGIEAARKFLIEEMTRVISFDGTYVNPRHIQLLVDSMTHTGEITSVRRDGIPRDVGPISKIMFEQAVDNAAQAAVFGEPDMMNSVSSSIMYGMTAKSGTGIVDVKPSDKIPSRPVCPDKPVVPEDEMEIDVTPSPVSGKPETPLEKMERRSKQPGSRRKTIIRKKPRD